MTGPLIAFDRVWHDGLWRVLKEYDIDNRLTDQGHQVVVR